MSEPNAMTGTVVVPETNSKSRQKRIAALTAPTPATFLQTAIERGTDLEQLKQLMELHDKWLEGQARRAFVAALSDAKAEIKPIVRNRKVDFPNRDNRGRTTYEHEDLAAIADHIDPILGKHGLSYRHKPRMEGGKLYVTCILSHRDGHFEEVTLEGPLDQSGNKNSIQQVGSTGTYLQRYTLKMALGLAVAHDDDGRAGSAGGGDDRGADQIETIGPGQLRELERLISEHRVDLPAFLSSIRVRSLREVAVESFDAVKAHILSKRQRVQTASSQGGSGPPPIKAAELEHLRKECDRLGVSERAVCEHMNIEILEDLKFAQLQPALTWLSSVAGGRRR